ncbi:hypothetical protein [Hydrogenophaga sp. PAMC20947]|uniref:hypothetical protein n=1 Tax=Hydrogenophaga sp. PAMC20947 TaxID=2565558 RepID=UPI001FF98934|nr:hypothetical protein [Hydrogenophaga sp. PAMC20947]
MLWTSADEFEGPLPEQHTPFTQAQTTPASVGLIEIRYAKPERSVGVGPVSRQGAKQERSIFNAQSQSGTEFVERALLASTQG